MTGSSEAPGRVRPGATVLMPPFPSRASIAATLSNADPMMTTLPATTFFGDTAEPEGRRNLPPRWIVAANTLVWYDFYIFIILSIFVFPKVFFPQYDIVAGALVAFSTYAVGYVARPLGAVVMGHIARRHGNRWSARTCQILLGASTAAIAAIPSHATAGLWAPIFLCVFRIVQGFAVGGQWGASVLVALEGSTRANRARAGARVQIGVSSGMLLAVATYWLISTVCGAADFIAWGWRIPVLLGGALIAVPARLRHSRAATDDVGKSTGDDSSITDLILGNAKEIMLTTVMKLFQNAIFYIYFEYTLRFSRSATSFDSRLGLAAVALSALVGLATIPMWAYLADKWGLKRIYLFGCLASAALAPIFFQVKDSGAPLLVVAMIVLGLNVLHDAAYAPQAALFAALFDDRSRLVGISLGFMASAALSGVMAPMIIERLSVADGEGYLVVNAYLFGLLGLSVIATLVAKPKYLETGNYG